MQCRSYSSCCILSGLVKLHWVNICWSETMRRPGEYVLVKSYMDMCWWGTIQWVWLNMGQRWTLRCDLPPIGRAGGEMLQQSTALFNSISACSRGRILYGRPIRCRAPGSLWGETEMNFKSGTDFLQVSAVQADKIGKTKTKTETKTKLETK